MKIIRPLILRALIVLLGVVLVVAILYDVSGWRIEKVLASVYGLEIWADNSSPRQYFADVRSGVGGGGHFDSYSVTRVANTVQVKVFNLYSMRSGAQYLGWLVGPHTIPLGSDFVPGVNYTVEVNDMTETFVA